MNNKLTQKNQKHRKSYSYSYICLVLFVELLLNFLSVKPGFAQNTIRNITIDQRINHNPLSVDGVGGGSIQAPEVVKTEQTSTGFCDGFVNRKPNHTLTVKKFFDFLKIEVDSPEDATMVVKGPGGIWCNDDANHTNPVIEGQWQPGVYKIWIGSYQENATSNYRIRISGSGN